MNLYAETITQTHIRNGFFNFQEPNFEWHDETLIKIEDDFIKVSKWARASIQIIDHFPYTVKRQYNALKKYSHLVLNRMNCSLLYSFILMTIFISWLFNYYCRLWPKLRFNKLFGPTENLAYTFMIISTSIGRLHVLIRSIVYAKRTFQFWRENCLLLQKFYKAGYTFHGIWFTWLQWETCSIFFTCTSLVIAQTIYVHIYTALTYNIIIGKRSFWPMLPDSEERLGSGQFL